MTNKKCRPIDQITTHNTDANFCIVQIFDLQNKKENVLMLLMRQHRIPFYWAEMIAQ